MAKLSRLLSVSSTCSVLLLSLLLPAQEALCQKRDVADTIRTIALPTATIIVSPRKEDVKFTEVTGRELYRSAARTIGDALSRVPGVQNSYFGPNSGLPVIRSLSGNRVRVLLNGVPLSDLSGISPNLSVNADINQVQSVEVYKGGAAVLFGGKAIGGAVDMKDNTIPVRLHSKDVSGSVSAEGSTNAGSKQVLDMNGGVGKSWAWHVGAVNRSNKDLKIPGNTKAPIAYDPSIDPLTQTLAQVRLESETTRNLSLYPYLSQFVLENLNNPAWGLSEGDLYTFQENSVIGGRVVPNPRNEKYVPGQDPATPFYTTIVKGIYDYAPVTRGIMPNSHAESRSFNAGATYIAENFYAGIGFRGASAYYGIPGFALLKMPGHTHGEASKQEEYLPINTRAISSTWMFETGYRPVSSLISALKLNYALQRSDDRELVGIYRVNRFNSERHSLRAEVEQQVSKFLNGTSGFDFTFLRMDGSGQSRYLPDNLGREFGLFTLQQVDLNPARLILGYRRDHVERRTMADDSYKKSRGLAGGNLSPRDFDLNHFNAGLQLNAFKKVGYIRASFAHSERAPDVNELYSGNNHFAIMLEENGDDRLKKETANTWELEGAASYKGFHLALAHYQTAFSNYMYLAHTGIARSGGFLVKEWRASDTEITGWEAQLAYKSSFGKGVMGEFSSFFDLVKNKNASDDPLRSWAEGDYMPNMPTSRFGFSSALNLNKTEINIAFDRYLQQRFLGRNINPEPPMPAYSMLGARVSYQGGVRGIKLEYYLSGSNLLDVEARPQNSFLKYLAPLPGRNISVGVKAEI